MLILYFTATGNSLAVAKKIGGNLVSIPQAIRNGQYEFEAEVIGFVFPAYCNYPPKTVRDFLSRANLRADYMFAVATYGRNFCSSGDGNEMREFLSLSRKFGYEFQYSNSILMVDNFIDMSEIDRQIEKIPSKNIEKQLAIQLQT